MTAAKYKCDVSKGSEPDATELKPDPTVYIDPNSSYSFAKDNLTRNIIDESKINPDDVRSNNEYDHAYFLFKQRHHGIGNSVRFNEEGADVPVAKVDPKV